MVDGRTPVIAYIYTTVRFIVIIHSHVFLTFEQSDKLKDVAKVLQDLIPDLNTTVPCYMSHQNVEGTIYCSECNPNGPDFILFTKTSKHTNKHI
jgi:hypothetical protein